MSARMRSADPSPSPSADVLYRAFWRWHFYAGLFVLPFILILATTGAIYLFRPQIDHWQERAYRDLGTRNWVSADRQLAAAMALQPGGRFTRYRLPEHPGDAAMIEIVRADGTARDVFVSPQGQVLGTIDPQQRLSTIVSRIHGTLLLGRYGDWLVELAASWTIVMILTGLFLWWPRPYRLAGAVWPRFSLRGRALFKDIHRVVGFWIAGLMLVMLASGLPWAGAWGTAFAWVRAEFGLVHGPQSWKIGAQADHTLHDHGAMATPSPTPMSSSLPLSVFVAKAAAEHLAFPAYVIPPRTPQPFGPATGKGWTAKSEAQNRLLDRQVTYDAATGAETGRRGFSDLHPIDRIVNTGVAWHEGQLFGLANQIIGLIVAIALVSIAIMGVAMWLKRRPRGRLGAPPGPSRVRTRWLIGACVALGILLPLFGLSLVVVMLLDRFMTELARRPRPD